MDFHHQNHHPVTTTTTTTITSLMESAIQNPLQSHPHHHQHQLRQRIHADDKCVQFDLVNYNNDSSHEMFTLKEVSMLNPT